MYSRLAPANGLGESGTSAYFHHWNANKPGTTLFLHEHPTSRALNGETDRGETLTVRRGPDGTESVIEVSANPLHDAKGRIRANRREDDDPGVSLRKRRA